MTESAFWCPMARDVLQVEGPDAQSYLHSQLSQDIAAVQTGATVWSFLLQPTGKVGALLRVTRTDDERFVLDVDAGHGDLVLARLDRFRIRVKAELSRLDWRCLAVRGPGAAGIPSWWSEPGAADLLGPSPSPPHGVASGDAAQLEAARIMAGWPAQGREIVEATIPGELGPLLDLAVSFTKGCYPGQELVERMNSRGAQAPRSLRRLRAATGDLVAGGAVVAGGRPVGAVTSAAGRRALALIARSAEPGAPADVEGVPVEILPLH